MTTIKFTELARAKNILILDIKRISVKRNTGKHFTYVMQIDENNISTPKYKEFFHKTLAEIATEWFGQ